MAKVYDASWHRPAPALLQPGDGIILYASRTEAKCPTAAECAAYRARGVIVRFVFEDSATRAAIGNYADGKADGALTLGQVKAKGGQRGDVVYFAADSNALMSLEYARGFRDGLTSFFMAGPYAGDRNLERARVSLGMTKLWQASAGSWSDHWNPAAHHGAYEHAVLYQVVGASPVPGTDLNVINDHAWHTVVGATTPEDDVSYSDWPEAAQQALYNDVASAVVARGVAPYNGTLAAILNDIRARVVAVGVAVGTLDPTGGGTLDAHAVAQEIITGLGPDLAHQVLVALNAALPNQ